MVKLTDAKKDEFEQISLRNMILNCEGNTKELSPSQFRHLKEAGLAEYRYDKGRILTPRGLEILNEGGDY